MLHTYKEVFGNLAYIMVAVVTGIVVLSFLILLPNLELLSRIAVSSSATFIDLLLLTGMLITSFTVGFSILSIFYVVTISLLFGINVAMVLFYIKTSKKLPRTKETVVGTSGMVGGVLGAGCVACGGIILSPLISLLGVGTVVALLPFNGSEFGIFGIIALLFSISIISKRIQKMNTC